MWGGMGHCGSKRLIKRTEKWVMAKVIPEAL
jgi:hypothetical protein